jgi:uncharacterized Zn ribbon protein
MKRKTLILTASISAGVLVLAGAGIWGGVAYAISAAQHDLDVANASLAKEYRADAAVVAELTADRASATKLVAAARPLVAATESLAAADARTKLGTALDAAGKVAAKTDVARLTLGPVKPHDGSLGAVQASVREARADLHRDAELGGVNTSSRAALSTQVKAVATALAAVCATAGASSTTVISANPLADAGARGAFTAQAAAVAKDSSGKTLTAPDLVTALVDYAVKGKQVIDSQAAAVAAQQAAAAAAAQAAQENARNGTSAGNGGSTTTHHSTSSLGAPSSGSSSPAAPTNGGGGVPAPTIPPRGSIVQSGACNPGITGASANWTSHLVVPANALNVKVTFEKPGDSWGVSWQCDTGW